MALNYREANLDDLPQLLALEQCVIEAERPYNSSLKRGGTTYYDLENLISSLDTHIIVAEILGAIVGTGYAQIRQSKNSLEHNNHASLGFMFVAPEHRGKGINQEIIDRLVAWSKKEDVRDFYLDVYSQNEAAIKAYQKAGFVPSMLEMKLSERKPHK